MSQNYRYGCPPVVLLQGVCCDRGSSTVCHHNLFSRLPEIYMRTRAIKMKQRRVRRKRKRRRRRERRASTRREKSRLSSGEVPHPTAADVQAQAAAVQGLPVQALEVPARADQSLASEDPCHHGNATKKRKPHTRSRRIVRPSSPVLLLKSRCRWDRLSQLSTILVLFQSMFVF